jgi:hypothetical protein
VNDLYLEKNKTLKKEIEEDTRCWKDLTMSWVGKSNITKNGNITKMNLQIQSNPHQYSDDTS